MAGREKKITCELTVKYVPIPPEKVAAWNLSLLIMYDLIFKSLLAQQQTNSTDQAKKDPPKAEETNEPT
jgi:hypothetical protein